jgi:hypothetical protein
MAEAHGRPPDFTVMEPVGLMLIKVHLLFLQTFAALTRESSTSTQSGTGRDITSQLTPANVGSTISISNALFPHVAHTICIFDAIFGPIAGDTVDEAAPPKFDIGDGTAPFPALRSRGPRGSRSACGSGTKYVATKETVATLNLAPLRVNKVKYKAKLTTARLGTVYEGPPFQLNGVQSCAAEALDGITNITEAPLTETDVGHAAAPAPACLFPTAPTVDLNTLGAPRNEDGGDINEYNADSDSSDSNDSNDPRLCSPRYLAMKRDMGIGPEGGYPAEVSNYLHLSNIREGDSPAVISLVNSPSCTVGSGGRDGINDDSDVIHLGFDEPLNSPPCTLAEPRLLRPSGACAHAILDGVPTSDAHASKFSMHEQQFARPLLGFSRGRDVLALLGVSRAHVNLIGEM